MIFGLTLRSGTATTFLQTTEQKGSRIPGLLVNDGFGVNQVVYMLSKIHRSDVETVLIEEPEIHLHPTVIRKFARSLTRSLATEERRSNSSSPPIANSFYYLFWLVSKARPAAAGRASAVTTFRARRSNTASLLMSRGFVRWTDIWGTFFFHGRRASGHQVFPFRKRIGERGGLRNQRVAVG